MQDIINEKTIFWMLLGLAVFLILYVYLHRHKHHKLRLVILFSNNKNQFSMASINSITLTDANPHTGLIQVVDGAGNVYTGSYANVVVSVADPTQDSATVDTTNPNTLDVQEKNPTGGTTGTLTLDFTSQGNATPPAGSTAQAIPDGTVFPGLTCQFVMINKVSAQLKLQVAF